ncbi:hypothetical protein LC040_04045 [Bacillus tianshenii]|nr:hypothetical protein LC040_04045 [Bacillus tianshenii]
MNDEERKTNLKNAIYSLVFLMTFLWANPSEAVMIPVKSSFGTNGVPFTMTNPYETGRIKVSFVDKSTAERELVEVNYLEKTATYNATCSSLYTFEFYDQNDKLKLTQQYYVPFPRYPLENCNRPEN